MNERTTFTLSPDDLRALAEIEESKPEWKYRKTSDKVREMFYYGYKYIKQKEQLNKAIEHLMNLSKEYENRHKKLLDLTHTIMPSQNTHEKKEDSEMLIWTTDLIKCAGTG